MVGSTASVSEPSVQVMGVPVTGFKHSAFNNVVGATFTHANGIEPDTTFSASIAWGDGSTSPGLVTRSGGTYQVLGSHAYMGEEHTYVVTLTVSEETTSAQATTPVTVREELLPGGTPGSTNQPFVPELFHNLLQRPVDAGGLAYWSGQLAGGATRSQVIQGIEDSREYRTDQVQGLYRLYLHRTADPMGLDNGIRFLTAGGTVEQLTAIFAGSPEYFHGRGGDTNDGFLDALFSDTLHRAVDAGARQFFDRQLATGTSRQQVAAEVLGADEYRGVLVDSFYALLLDRPADRPGLAYFVDQLRHGTRDEQVVLALAASNEYFVRL